MVYTSDYIMKTDLFAMSFFLHFSVYPRQDILVSNSVGESRNAKNAYPTSAPGSYSQFSLEFGFLTYTGMFVYGTPKLSDEIHICLRVVNFILLAVVL